MEASAYSLIVFLSSSENGSKSPGRPGGGGTGSSASACSPLSRCSLLPSFLCSAAPCQALYC
eukprot:2438994-Amphidinium_carterae.1